MTPDQQDEWLRKIELLDVRNGGKAPETAQQWRLIEARHRAAVAQYEEVCGTDDELNRNRYAGEDGKKLVEACSDIEWALGVTILATPAVDRRSLAYKLSVAKRWDLDDVYESISSPTCCATSTLSSAACRGAGRRLRFARTSTPRSSRDRLS